MDLIETNIPGKEAIDGLDAVLCNRMQRSEKANMLRKYKLTLNRIIQSILQRGRHITFTTIVAIMSRFEILLNYIKIKSLYRILSHIDDIRLQQYINTEYTRDLIFGDTCLIPNNNVASIKYINNKYTLVANKNIKNGTFITTFPKHIIVTKRIDDNKKYRVTTSEVYRTARYLVGNVADNIVSDMKNSKCVNVTIADHNVIFSFYGVIPVPLHNGTPDIKTTPNAAGHLIEDGMPITAPKGTDEYIKQIEQYEYAYRYNNCYNIYDATSNSIHFFASRDIKKDETFTCKHGIKYWSNR